MNYLPHPDDPCYNRFIRIYESDIEDENEQNIDDFCEEEYDFVELLNTKNNEQ